MVASALLAVAYGFSNGKMKLNFALGTQKNAFDYPSEKQVYGITFDEFKDIVKNGGVNPSDSLTPQNENALVSESDAQKILEDGKLDIEEILTYAENGNPYFQFCMGRAFDRGRGVEQNYEKAVHWYTLSAEQNFRMAQNNLTCLYLDGEGVTRAAEKSFEKAKTALAELQ